MDNINGKCLQISFSCFNVHVVYLYIKVIFNNNNITYSKLKKSISLSAVSLAEIHRILGIFLHIGNLSICRICKDCTHTGAYTGGGHRGVIPQPEPLRRG